MCFFGASSSSQATLSANASNQAMQLTASKPVVYAWSVCRRERMLRGMRRGLAAADLVLVRPRSRTPSTCAITEDMPDSTMHTLYSLIAIGMKRSLPIAVALTPDATVSTRGELKQAVSAIAGAALSQQVGDLMCYARLTQIDNLDIDIPAGALSSVSQFPGVYIF